MTIKANTIYNPECWLAKNGRMEKGKRMPPCDGRIVRVHLIDKQVLKRLELDPDDPRTYVLGCGGIMGNAGHHGMFDHRKLIVAYRSLPASIVPYAIQNGLLPWIERRYRHSL